VASSWVSVGYTFYNDEPPGAGHIEYGGYSFAELGTADKKGAGTGVGNLATAMGLGGEEALGSTWSLYAGHVVVQAQLRDHGYGQGSDPIHSDPRYAVDLWDGSHWGRPNLVAALGAGSSGALWIMRGRWHPPMALPPGAAHLQALGGLVAGPASVGGSAGVSSSRHDYSHKVQHTGKHAGEHGSTVQRINTALSTLPARYRR
jgi:hypothetical protein